MDALLWELLAEGSPDDHVEVLIRLTELEKLPYGIIKVIAQIGHIASCRIRRGDIETIHEDDAVLSMKAQKLLYLDPPLDEHYHTIPNDSQENEIKQHRPKVNFTGKGTALGIADWGFDFTHPNFLYPDGNTRFISIWDQGGEYDGYNIYGFGTIHSREDINNALASEFPFLTMNYHPGKNDLYQQGMHGTHVLDIAAGNGNVGATGLAPESDLIAVHLATDKFSDLMGLGTSVRVFDALHFLDSKAGIQPLVINMSVGSHGDAHTGRSLIEQAIDHLVTAKLNRAIVQSCGNYFASRIHTEGYILNDDNASLEWLISNQDKTPNEIEVWYEPQDEVQFSLQAPDGRYLFQEKGIDKLNIQNNNGDEIGRYYHRENEPNSKLNQVLIILNDNADSGKWIVTLTGKKIISGRYQSWIERDRGNLSNQSRFSLSQSINTTTTGSICNGFYTISVGAYNSTDKEKRIAFFSSSGPTWDSRQKPDLVAPGVGIRAAKSASPYQSRSQGELISKTGTSMAAPFVAGAIALLYEASSKPLTNEDVYSRLQKACWIPDTWDETDKRRSGNGLLSIEELCAHHQITNSESDLTEKKYSPMKDLNLLTEPIESLMEILQDQLPALSNGYLESFFESLPSKRQFENTDVQRGDILIRCQYGHHKKVWYGVVDFVNENEAYVLTSNGPKRILLSKDNKQFNWELKKMRPVYEHSSSDLPTANDYDFTRIDSYEDAVSDDENLTFRSKYFSFFTEDSTALTQEQKVADLKAGHKLDFTGKITYLNFLDGLSLNDSLQSLFTLSNISFGVEAILDLMDRMYTGTEATQLQNLDRRGALKKLQIVYNDDVPGSLTAAEQTETANFFANQMEISRREIQNAYDPITSQDKLSRPGGAPKRVRGRIVKCHNPFSLGSFPRNADAKTNAKNIIENCIKFGILNKKRIAYMLAIANGESGFLPIMEGNRSHAFAYYRRNALYYYKEEGKASYNRLRGQTQLSDYLIRILIGAGYILVVDLGRRAFDIGPGIDRANFNGLVDLLTVSMSTLRRHTWTDRRLDAADTDALFTAMEVITDTSGGRLITDNILRDADFYRYAGKGIIQTTGRPTYARLTANIRREIPTFSVDFELNPEALLDPLNSIFGIVLALKTGTYGDGIPINRHLPDNTDKSWYDARKMVNGYSSFQEFAQCGKVYYEIVFRGRG